jgi:DNA-binding NarL/FixJ family response regulator
METSGCLERYCCDLVNVLTGDHMNPLRILVADDHEIVRRGLVSLLKSHAGWDVCGEAADGRQALSKAKELRPSCFSTENPQAEARTRDETPCPRSGSIGVGWWVVLKLSVAARGQPDGAAHVFLNMPLISQLRHNLAC